MVRLSENTQESQEVSNSGRESDRGPETGSDTHGGTATAHSGNASATAEGVADGDTDPEEQSISLDLIFEILRNHRRRRVLRTLTETEQIELGDLAEQIAARELDKPRRELSSQERKRLYVALYQSHLPKMADADAITYEERRGLIEPGPALHSFISLLPGESESPTTEARDGRWTDYIPNLLK